tara:strand:- start:1982 stop:2389 length:408 start_codon:yes stop_codon:yes gene_type:complete
MSKNLYEATILQLKGRALEAYAALELLLKNPTGIPDHSNWVDEIIRHTQTLAENENAIIKLQQYFGKHFQDGTPLKNSVKAHPQTAEQKEIKQRMMETLKKRQKELYPMPDEAPSHAVEAKDESKKKSKKTKPNV